MSNPETLQLDPAGFEDRNSARISAYNNLSPLLQDIVHLLAVFYDVTTRTHLAKSLKNLTADFVEAKKFSPKGLDPLLNELFELGLIEKVNSLYQCSRFLVEPVCRLLSTAGRFHDIATAIRDITSIYVHNGRPYFSTYEQLLREARISLYRFDIDYLSRILSVFEMDERFRNRFPHPYLVVFANKFDSKWIMETLPTEIQLDIAAVLARFNLRHRYPLDPDRINFLMQVLNLEAPENLKDIIRTSVAEQWVLRGRLAEAEAILPQQSSMVSDLIRGFIAFVSGRNAEALSHYATALAILKKTTRKRKVYFNTLSGLFYFPALIKSGTPLDIETAKQLLSFVLGRSYNLFSLGYQAFHLFVSAPEGDPDAPGLIEDLATTTVMSHESIARFISLLCLYWTNKKQAGQAIETIKELYDTFNRNGYHWLSMETAELMARTEPAGRVDSETSAAFFATSGIQSIVDLFQSKNKWQRALSALIQLKKETTVDPAKEKTSRLIWLFYHNDKYGDWQIYPLEQVKAPKGNWSKGRKIAMKRLFRELDSFDFLTAQDRAVCACIEQETLIFHGYPEIQYRFKPKALSALAGHPLVFRIDSPNVAMEIVAGRPEMIVNRQENGSFQLTFPHAYRTDRDVQIIAESPNRVKIIETGEDILRIVKIIGKKLEIPAAGEPQLLDAIHSVSTLLTILSGMDGIGMEAEEIPADPTPQIHLRPFGEGLKIEIWIQPFASGGPSFRPGEGGETVISEIGGKLLRTRRDFNLEIQSADRVPSACPMLSASEEPGERRWQWALETPEDCLEVLLALKAFGDSAVLKWPEGETFHVRQQADMKRFFIRIQKQADWFSVSGELKVDDKLVLSMETLLALLKDAKGRFVRLESGQFLALTREFIKRLNDIAVYSRKVGETRRFHPLAVLPLKEMAGNFGGFQTDPQWKAHIKRFDEAQSLTPQIPSTFQAELRDYQAEGFYWLARLSHWGVGACLADDMGLGKTIQALAVLLMGAAGGPSLVVAPTSVCMNWETEAKRFAPSLTVISLGNAERRETMKSLGPFDLLLISYGLLQQEKVAEMLSDVHFKTVVLDEAQAIKNLTTKRSQAAMNLKGDFKLITTGTPIENHLGELWNLFRFINPGLLGTFDEFNETFALPIEKNRDKAVRNRLKKLLQPFILRRTKTQVLEELPPRTDIILQVELSDEEQAFYEALRKEAIENLAANDGDTQNMHLRILAEIMKLRRACCNARLVHPEATLPSAKLSVFGEIVSDLIANGHKALVFSQFTGHLDIIRKYVAAQSIPYQYLDGATPQRERKKRVDAFQGGQGDLFLISLKAGGFGLNLTAADYVIHMDPWWNPAVLDQASDRVHRIGQERPVTVYSLIARHTIEEKIVALHKTKRALADSLLDGADMSGKMSADELLRLIWDT